MHNASTDAQPNSIAIIRSISRRPCSPYTERGPETVYGEDRKAGYGGDREADYGGDRKADYGGDREAD